MKLVKVNELPSKKRAKKKLQIFIETFYNMDVAFAKVEFEEHEYKDASVCCSCLSNAVKRSKLPVVVSRRDNEIYISKVLEGE